MKFFIVPDSVVGQWQLARNDIDGLCFIKDLYDRWVINIEVCEKWPEIDWNGMAVIELTQDDFPKPDEE